jgi:hypothetical protein
VIGTIRLRRSGVDTGGRSPLGAANHHVEPGRVYADHIRDRSAAGPICDNVLYRILCRRVKGVDMKRDMELIRKLLLKLEALPLRRGESVHITPGLRHRSNRLPPDANPRRRPH